MEPSRNKPCPCGSGKRYKACCGRIAPSEVRVEPYAERVARAARLFGAGQVAAARELLLLAQAERPDDAECALALAMVALQENDTTAARRWLTRTLQLCPDDVELHNNLAAMLLDIGAVAEAGAALQRALALAPTDADVWGNLGNVRRAEGDLAGAEQCYRRLSELRPADANAWGNLANVLVTQSEPVAAVQAYQRALQLAPDNSTLYGGLLLALNYRTDQSLDEVYQWHLGYDRQVEHRARQPMAARPPGRLRIGYVTADLRHHAAFWFIQPMLAHHDRTRFEVHVFSTLATGDAITNWAMQRVDHWHVLAGLSDVAAAAKIEDCHIDLLIDLAGHTAGNRLPVFALRPAPIQISWLGYGNTTGLAEMDYLISDAVSSPLHDPQPFRETLLRLPVSRLCYAPPEAPAVAPPPALRQGHITFGCFNNPAKLNPQVLQLWSELLRALPTARLLLKPFDSEPERERWRGKLRAAGIDPQRVELRAGTPHAAMLAEYAEVDIVLDPFPFTGGATTCEALWCGVPVVTLRGNSLLGRQGASLLHAAGLQAWVADTPADYLQRAMDLAHDVPALAAQRQQQRAQIKQSALCDGARFTRALEHLLSELQPL